MGQALERYMGNYINTESRVSLFLLNCINTLLKNNKTPSLNTQLNNPHKPQMGSFVIYQEDIFVLLLKSVCN